MIHIQDGVSYDYDAIHINGTYEISQMEELTTLSGLEFLVAELQSPSGQKRKFLSSLLLPNVENVTNAENLISVNAHSDIESEGIDIDDAVNKKHSQGTDTTLGILDDDIDAGGYGIKNLSYLALGDLATGSGRFAFERQDSPGDFDVVLINEPHLQTTIYSIPDAGVAAATIPSNRNLNKLLFDAAQPLSVVSVPGSGTLIFNDDHLIINAIHSDISDEISAITEKLYPVIWDVYLLEDSEDSSSKKCATGENIAKSFNMDLFQEGATYKKYSLIEQEKLAGIEPNADVTDVENVTAALASIVVASLQDITSAGTDIEDAVSLRHPQGTDTTLGTMTAPINMNDLTIRYLSSIWFSDDATHGWSGRAFFGLSNLQQNFDTSVNMETQTDQGVPTTLIKIPDANAELAYFSVNPQRTYFETLDTNDAHLTVPNSGTLVISSDPNLQNIVHTDVASEYDGVPGGVPNWDDKFLAERSGTDGAKRAPSILGIGMVSNIYHQLDEYAQTVTGQEFLSIEHPTTGEKYSMLVDDIFFRRAFYESTIPFTTGVMYVEWFDGSIGSIRNYHFLHKLTNTVSGEEQTYEVLVNIPQDVFSDTVYNKPKPYIEITNLSYEQTPWLEEVVVQSSIAGQALIYFHYTDITNLTFEFLNLYDSTNKVPFTSVASQSTRPSNLKQTIDVKLRKTSSVDSTGSVKIISNGDLSQPTYSLSPGVPQQITYSSPLLDSEVFYPETAPAKDVTSIYGDTGGYTGIFQENPVLGQPQYWRIAFDYSGKTLLSNAGLYVSLYNPVNGFTTQIPLTLPAGENAHTNLAVDIATFADHNSLGAPYGSGAGGYQLFFESTQESVNIIVQSVARLTWR